MRVTTAQNSATGTDATADGTAPKRRPFIDKEHPSVQKALVKASTASRTASHGVGMGDDTIELINMRVSQINGCLTCLSLHAPRARDAGVTQQQLDLLPAWRDAMTMYSGAQRAALLIAESLTVIDTSQDRDAVVAQAGAAPLDGADRRSGMDRGHDQRVQPRLDRERPPGTLREGVTAGG